MKKIYLKDRNSNWKEFDYELLSELSEEFKKRNIKIEESAKIGADAKIGVDATIGAGATIEAGATIGAMAKIGARATIGAWATIEAWAEIGELAKIEEMATIGVGAKIGAWATIGARAEIGAGATIGADAKIGAWAKICADAMIEEYNSFFAVNLYKYTCGAWIEENEEIIQLGCFTRTRKEWEAGFWNNKKEFPNDDSEKTKARLRAFKMCCTFLDLIKNK